MDNPASRLEDVITDLMYLRKGEGFSLVTVRNASTLMEILGGIGQTFDQLMARFIAAICSLNDEQSVTALLVAYGLEEGFFDVESLTDRRKKYGRQIGRKADTIANRENAAILELAIILIMAEWTNAPMPANVPVIHGDFIVDYLNATILIRDKTLIETREAQRLVALADGLGDFDLCTNEDSTLVETTGCTVESETVAGGIKHVITFPAPLKRGQVYELSTIETSPVYTDRKPVAVEVARSFAIPTFTYNLELVFIGQKPSIIWAYDKLNLIERPGSPDSQALLGFKSGGSTISRRFTHLHGGLFSGVAWEW